MDAGRLRGMLERALAVVVLALLPMALSQLPISSDYVWQGCVALVFVASPALNWSLIYRLRQLPNYAPGATYFLSSQVGLALELSVLAAGFSGAVPLESAYGLQRGSAAGLISLTFIGWGCGGLTKWRTIPTRSCAAICCMRLCSSCCAPTRRRMN